MAARTNRIQIDENTRKKIQASQLINRLTDHILKDTDMSATQVNAALGLLKKTLPDLKQLDIDGQMDTRTTLIVKDLTGANTRD
jgi:predicted RNase H-related nuclease YkuK (DUF458 family)